MYLSRLILNPRSRQVQREIANPYQLHRTILRAFPETLPEGERVLFRLELHPRSGEPTLLVQSQTPPDWDWLFEKDYLLPAIELSPGAENPAVKAVALHLRPGQTLAFRLRANPTKRLGKSAGEGKGKRVGIYDEQGQIEWLLRKAEAGGFHVLQARTSQDAKLKDTIHRPNADDQKLELFAIQFDGLLQVTDPQKLVETVANGIGSAKGFGFGLLSLAPARG